MPTPANFAKIAPFLFTTDTAKTAAKKGVAVRQSIARFKAGLPMDDRLQFRICRRLNRSFLDTLRRLDREEDPGKRLKHALTMRALRETWHLVSNTPFPGVYRHRPDRSAKQLLPMPVDVMPATLAAEIATEPAPSSQAIDSQEQSLGCKPAEEDLPY